MTVTARNFQSRTVEVLPGELYPEERIIIAVELSNGRTLLLDDWGVVDEQDLDADKPLAVQRLEYVAWDEFVGLLDTLRGRAKN